MQDNFSIRDWKNTKLYKESYEGSLEEGMPSQEEVMDFLRSKGEETHYLMDKPVSTWDEYDLSNWKAKKKRLGEQDDFEADADEIEFEIPGDENAKPVVDKELNKSLSKQDKIIKQWQDINAQMQRNLKNFKEAEDEDAKDMAKLALKDLTPAYRAAKDAYEKLKGVKL
jgi:hypothetical protein